MIILAGNQFFRIFGKTGSRIQNFFGLKPSRDQDGANQKSLAKSVQPFRSYEGIHRQRSYYFKVRILFFEQITLIEWKYKLSLEFKIIETYKIKFYKLGLNR